MQAHDRVFLLILDGWGLGTKAEADAIRQANTPFMNSLMQQYPWSTLVTHGEDVGLPIGQMGNSEVGHLNIGAGRVVWQELARINRAVRDKEFFQMQTLITAFEYANSVRSKVHLVGLVSDGGVHSHIDHLKALCDMAVHMKCRDVFIHAFTDGRDCDPKSGAGFIEDLERHIAGTPVRLASVIGRYYAMDRDKRWERVKLAYDLLVHAQGDVVSDFPAAIRASYASGVTDEFLKPMVRQWDTPRPPVTLDVGDVVICFNFRTDRLRELTMVLTQQNMPEAGMRTIPLYYLTMTRYDDSFKDIFVLFDKDHVTKTLGEVIEDANRTQLRIAETEKYPHVTFFFSGGREQPFENERRILIPSPKVATYDLQPEMSAPEITAAVLQDMREHRPDFICLNFANPDMVGHTGVFSAAIKAAETVDRCLAQIIPLALELDYGCLIIADHGNSDYMINDDGTPNTAHTKNPVPCILVSTHIDGSVKMKNGRLADVAPTLLHLLRLNKPAEMTGQSLMVQE